MKCDRIANAHLAELHGALSTAKLPLQSLRDGSLGGLNATQAKLDTAKSDLAKAKVRASFELLTCACRYSHHVDINNMKLWLWHSALILTLIGKGKKNIRVPR
jgi:hypothetical protein